MALWGPLDPAVWAAVDASNARADAADPSAPGTRTGEEHSASALEQLDKQAAARARDHAENQAAARARMSASERYRAEVAVLHEKMKPLLLTGLAERDVEAHREAHRALYALRRKYPNGGLGAEMRAWRELLDSGQASIEDMAWSGNVGRGWL